MGTRAPYAPMTQPGHNHADRQLRASPRDYFAHPPAFGTPHARALVLPVNGSSASQRVAWMQHQLVQAWKRHARHGDARRVSALYGISPSTWSRILHGQRWAGSIGMAALLDYEALTGEPEHSRER